MGSLSFTRPFSVGKECHRVGSGAALGMEPGALAGSRPGASVAPPGRGPGGGSGPLSLLGGVADPGRGYHAYRKVRPPGRVVGAKEARHGKKHDEKAKDDKAKKDKDAKNVKKDKKDGSSY
jgi:hypothetical protein